MLLYANQSMAASPCYLSSNYLNSKNQSELDLIDPCYEFKYRWTSKPNSHLYECMSPFE